MKSNKCNFIDTYKTKEINVIHNTRYEFYYLSNRIKFSNLKALARSRWPDSRTIATSRP